MRARRRALSSKERERAARNLANTARRCRPLWRAKRLLHYRAFEGEISPHRLMQSLPSADTWLPRIVHYGHNTMRFYPDRQLDRFNRYGILEPSAVGEPLRACQFDVVIMPLVAFDRRGSRIGMGAGFYDRALQSLGHQNSVRPFLIGAAHAFQELEQLPTETWDVPLDAILTDQEYIPIEHVLDG